MNSVTLTGVVDSPELRTVDGHPLMNFSLTVDGPPKRTPRIRCGYFIRNGDAESLADGTHVMVVGRLAHRVDSGLFIAVSDLFLLASLQSE